MEFIEYLKFSTGQEKADIDNWKLKNSYNLIQEFIEHDRTEQLKLNVVGDSFNLEIKDRDIATIEALHDTLLDEKVLGLNARSMKESRALTERMYEALSKD